MTLVAIKNHFTIYSHPPLAICYLPLAICHQPLTSPFTTLHLNPIPRQPCASERTGIGSTASAGRHNSREEPFLV
ncbi:hypothetical protein BC792_12231 [Sphingobacterium allocomposti]|uniref:Uncharacterized protein n=1 Tax=Sphingobacterium allocomposti TaxID=415956 RepID=A0A5S5D6J8_9SPHI|nr:hypothetical protein BC792_12231 [Sphingobacterium composti Yoo et al. 2007 non Ten et al. 2007]